VAVLGVWDPVPIRGSRDERVAAVASRQRGRVTRAQLLAAGVSRSMIETMLRNGRLQARYPGVYALAGAGDAELARETEALLASPPGAALNHRSATAAWQLLPHDGQIVDVIVPGDTIPRLPGIRAHRSSTLDPKKDVRVRHGLPVTSPARTFVDIAGDTPEPQLERALDDALARNLLRLTQLTDALTRAGPTRKGARRLRALIADREHGRGLSRSDAELILKRLLQAADVPAPDLNANFGRYVPDMVWSEQRVIVEVDSWRWHGGRAKFEDDRRRDATLTAQGWTILRFTARQIEREPYRVIAQIAAALAHGDARRSV
jgi:very-short-patch-repair endonuclease